MPRYLAIAGFLILLVLHLDFWGGDWSALAVGFMPGELVYRLGWVLLSWLYLLAFCRWVWEDDPEP